MQACPNITQKIADLVVVATTKVQKLEFKDNELQQLCAYVQYIGVQIVAKEDLMQQWDAQHESMVLDIVTRKVNEFDHKKYLQILQIKWEWHPFYHFLINSPNLWNKLLVLPLQHNVIKGLCMQSTFSSMALGSRIFLVPIHLGFFAILIFETPNYHMSI
jgi:hypothetical protein